MTYYAHDRVTMPERMLCRRDVSDETVPCTGDLELVMSFPDDLIAVMRADDIQGLREDLERAFQDIAGCRIHVRCYSASIRLSAQDRSPRDLCQDLLRRLPRAVGAPTLPIQCHRIESHAELDKWDHLRAEHDACRSMGQQYLPFVMRKGATILEMRMLLQHHWAKASQERVEGIHVAIPIAAQGCAERAAA